MSNRIEKLEAPAIPFSYAEYDLSLQNQKDNVFRLFFNRLTSLLSNLLSIDNGGKFLYFPYAQFYCATGQTLAAINTAQAVGYDTIQFSNGVDLVANTDITFSVAGMYQIDVILQLRNSGGANAVIFVWLEVDGVAVPYSANEYIMRGVVNSQIASFSSVISVPTEGVVRVMWASNNIDVFLLKEDPTALHPGVPCVEVSVTFLSNAP
jgi:hypothetical protein